MHLQAYKATSSTIYCVFTILHLLIFYSIIYYINTKCNPFFTHQTLSFL